MDGHFSCFYSLWPIIQGLIVAMQGLRYLLFWYLSFFVCPSPKEYPDREIIIAMDRADWHITSVRIYDITRRKRYELC